jgi:hypothetical protein
MAAGDSAGVNNAPPSGKRGGPPGGAAGLSAGGLKGTGQLMHRLRWTVTL